MKQKALSIILTLTMVLSMLPNLTLTAAAASATVYYVDAQGQSQGSVQATVVESNTTTWSDTWYVVNKAVTISGRIEVTGTVNLILADNGSLNAESGGIRVSSGNSLTIWGQSGGSGSLSALSEAENAGIGGNYGENTGSITINGGIVTAESKSLAAGIGGARSRPGGTITINGGTVTATAHASTGDPAGIGGGAYGAAGTITINGGNVTAHGTGKGIGGGASTYSGTIEINGGTVRANGIGEGDNNSNTPYTYIDGGIVILTSGRIKKTYASSWNGIVYEQSSGQVYGDAEVKENLTLPENGVLTIPEGNTLTVKGGVTLTNNDTITNKGTITINGTLNNTGMIINEGTITPTQTEYTVTAPTGLSPVYDGANQALVTAGIVSPSGSSGLQYRVNGGDYSAGTPTGKNAGNYTVDYKAVGPGIFKPPVTGTVSVSIGKKELTISVAAVGRTYEQGNTRVTVNGTLNGVCGNDNVSLDTSRVVATMTDDSAGTGKTVTVSGYALTGTDAGNYTLKEQSIVASVDIAQASQDTPDVEITVEKTSDSIKVTNPTGDMYEYSIGDGNWQDDVRFIGLEAGKTYTVSVRYAESKNYSASEAAQKAVITANEDGSATVLPGETVGDVTNNGDSVTVGDTTVTPAPESGAQVDQDGSLIVPGGSTVKPDNGPEMTLPDGGVLGGDGSVTFPEGGTVQIGDTTVTVPKGGTIAPNEDGGLTLPAGSTVRKADGPPETVPKGGGTLDGEGNFTPSSGSGSDGGDDGPGTTPAPTTPSGGGSSGSPGPATYPPTISKPDNGKVSVSPSSPTRGDTVTVTPVPDDGYEVSDVVIKDRNGNELEVKDNGDGTFSFTQPAGKVTIEITFVPQKGEPESPALAFSDLNPGAWYWEAVDYVLRTGLMNGYGDGTFGPGDDLSRAMLAQILYNAEGRPGIDSSSSFTDVLSGTWYADAVTWAAANGIVVGNGNGLYGPNDSISREQLAVMLYRYAQTKDDGSLDAWTPQLDYTDAAEISDWAYDAMVWCTENGIIEGKGNGTLDPKGKATRAEAAAMLMRFLSHLMVK